MIVVVVVVVVVAGGVVAVVATPLVIITRLHTPLDPGHAHQVVDCPASAPPGSLMCCRGDEGGNTNHEGREEEQVENQGHLDCVLTWKPPRHN